MHLEFFLNILIKLFRCLYWKKNKFCDSAFYNEKTKSKHCALTCNLCPWLKKSTNDKKSNVELLAVTTVIAPKAASGNDSKKADNKTMLLF